MLKLAKYEFRKNRTFLIIIAAIAVILESYFLISLIIDDNEHVLTSALFLVMYAFICYFMVFILSISNYSKELNSRSSYLIFMTPNSALSIILSKMFTILIIGTAIICVFCAFWYVDINLASEHYSDIEELAQLKYVFKFMMSAFEVNVTELALNIVSYALSFIISFFATVTLVYMAITLSATLFQNNRFKGLMSCIIFFALTAGVNKVRSLMPLIYNDIDTLTLTKMLINLLPSTLVNLCIIIGCVLGCAALLEKKVSL